MLVANRPNLLNLLDSLPEKQKLLDSFLEKLNRVKEIY